MKATDHMSPLTHARVRELLDYEPSTGWLIWKVGGQFTRAGVRAGSLNKVHGYREVGVDGLKYRSARLAFFWMTGEWPGETVDHGNLNRDDDSWDNLRGASHQEQSANRGMLCTNRSGHKGVSWHKPLSKWYASIKIDGKSRNLGYYDNIKDAASAYAEALVAAFGAFARS